MRTATGGPGPAPAPRERAGPLLAHDHPPQPRGCGFALFPDAGSAPPRTPPSTLAHRLPEAGGAPGSAPLRGSAHLRPPAPSSRPFLDPDSAGTLSACAPCASARTQRRTRGTDTLPILQTRSCDGAELPPPGGAGPRTAPWGRAALREAGEPVGGGSRRRPRVRPARGSGRCSSAWIGGKSARRARALRSNFPETQPSCWTRLGFKSSVAHERGVRRGSAPAQPPLRLRPEPGQRGADLGGGGGPTPDRPPPSERIWFLRSRINHRLSNKPPSIRIYNYQTCPARAPRLRPLRPPRAESGQTWKPPGTQASTRTRPRPRSSRRKDQRAEPSIKDLFKLSN